MVREMQFDYWVLWRVETFMMLGVLKECSHTVCARTPMHPVECGFDQN